MKPYDRSGNHRDRTHDGHVHEQKKIEPVIVPAFLHTLQDGMRRRSARAQFVLEMFSLNPKGFRERSKKNPMDMSYVDAVHVSAGLTTAPEYEPTKRRKIKNALRKAFLKAFKNNPNQHRSNWQANHKGELRNDTIARIAAAA